MTQELYPKIRISKRNKARLDKIGQWLKDTGSVTGRVTYNDIIDAIIRQLGGIIVGED